MELYSEAIAEKVSGSSPLIAPQLLDSTGTVPTGSCYSNYGLEVI